MGEKAVTIVDTNVLVNLATPVVDGRPRTPSGADPLKALLTKNQGESLALQRGEEVKTPHLLCTLATHDILSVEYVAATLTYYTEIGMRSMSTNFDTNFSTTSEETCIDHCNDRQLCSVTAGSHS